MYYAVIKIVDGMFEINYKYKPNDCDSIYDKMMELTDGDHEESANAAGWCELAEVGEVYEFREGKIEIMDID